MSEEQSNIAQPEEVENAVAPVVFFDYQIKTTDQETLDALLFANGIIIDPMYGPVPGYTVAVYGVHYDWVGSYPDAYPVAAEGFWCYVRSVTEIAWSDDVEIVPPPFKYLNFA